MICVRGVLYMWVVPGSPLSVMQKEARLYRSRDHGTSWEPAEWAFTRDEYLTVPAICQFGRNYSGARDRYVYHYFVCPRDEKSDSIQRPGTLYLARCEQEKLMNRGAYEFFTGMERRGALWTKDVVGKAPVFEDRDNGTGWVMSGSYNGGLRRYLLMTDHLISNRGNLGIFDAPGPWEPWTTVLYLDEAQRTNFGASYIEPNTFFWNLTHQMAEQRWDTIHPGVHRLRLWQKQRQLQPDSVPVRTTREQEAIVRLVAAGHTNLLAASPAVP